MVVQTYGGLTLHLAGRFDQVCFKLHAAVDRVNPEGKHVQDLRALEPTREELLRAARWTRSQDPSEGFRQLLIQALASGGAGSFGAARERATRALLGPVWQWLLRARDAGVIRRVRPQPTTLQLLGLVLLEPAWTPAEGPAGLRPPTRARRRELDAWVRAALAPLRSG